MFSKVISNTTAKDNDKLHIILNTEVSRVTVAQECVC